MDARYVEVATDDAVSCGTVGYLPPDPPQGARFAARWGWWPMEGWLRAFAERGLIRPEGDGWTRI